MKQTVILVDDQCDHVQEVAIPENADINIIKKLLRTTKVQRNVIELKIGGHYITVSIFRPRNWRTSALTLTDRSHLNAPIGRYVLEYIDTPNDCMLSLLRPCYTSAAGAQGNVYGKIEVDRIRWLL